MEAIELYKEETAKMEEQGGANQKVLMIWFHLKNNFITNNLLASNVQTLRENLNRDPAGLRFSRKDLTFEVNKLAFSFGFAGP